MNTPGKVGYRALAMKTFIPLCQDCLWLCALCESRTTRDTGLLGSQLDTYLTKGEALKHSRELNTDSLGSATAQMLDGSD